MRETITVSVDAEDWTSYRGLKGALEDAIEKMKDSHLIRQITKLMTECEDSYEEFTKKHKVMEDIKRDFNELSRKVDGL